MLQVQLKGIYRETVKPSHVHTVESMAMFMKPAGKGGKRRAALIMLGQTQTKLDTHQRTKLGYPSGHEEN